MAAFRDDGELVVCGYAKSASKSGHGPRESATMAEAVRAWWHAYTNSTPRKLVLEFAQVYPRGENRTKADPNVAVLPLVGVVCAVAALFPQAEVAYFQPHAWKGGVPKEDEAGMNVVDGRIRDGRLTGFELASYDAGLESVAASMRHNVVDAVALGMYALGRFKRKRVITR